MFASSFNHNQWQETQKSSDLSLVLAPGVDDVEPWLLDPLKAQTELELSSELCLWTISCFSHVCVKASEMPHPRMNTCPLDRLQNHSTDQWRGLKRRRKIKLIKNIFFLVWGKWDSRGMFWGYFVRLFQRVIRIMLSVFIVFRTRSNTFRLQGSNMSDCLRMERAVTHWNTLSWAIKKVSANKESEKQLLVKLLVGQSSELSELLKSFLKLPFKSQD